MTNKLLLWVLGGLVVVSVLASLYSGYSYLNKTKVAQFELGKQVGRKETAEQITVEMVKAYTLEQLSRQFLETLVGTVKKDGNIKIPTPEGDLILAPLQTQLTE